ncbi:MAG: DUF4019 domain-containing protein [Pseudomonadales bacterium]|jgi:hypothetical protein|nr:DUF4019 domain-containing protein [Pseudomonadales bacterium]MDP6470441.1 DUF4019 domain-containing protein [Pseudomonadales bacterium]MDP6827742.1 DUF4019 domain-containing protein [Pseudomonadales bacterium]MDP6973385.1 DUF4019 domain-containing protein [Pseudomonadales bacterium]|tara:strand:- start:458 stop:892 length:435 start_codon:yes stop_codon:yes gene_type:complete
MKTSSVIGLQPLPAIALIAFCLCAPVQANDQIEFAEQNTLTWLALIDAGEYARSWSGGAALFRERVTQSQWEQALRSARPSFGTLVSRVRSTATHKKSLPGAPDGHYVVFQFATSFQHKQAATETVTSMQEADGQWRVAGYYIQ